MFKDKMCKRCRHVKFNTKTFSKAWQKYTYYVLIKNSAINKQNNNSEKNIS